jgi:hypothetical protein
MRGCKPWSDPTFLCYRSSKSFLIAGVILTIASSLETLFHVDRCHDTFASSIWGIDIESLQMLKRAVIPAVGTVPPIPQ